MSSKMKLSSKATQDLEFLSNRLNMKRNVICRMALGYSLGMDVAPEFDEDYSGQEFNKPTIIPTDEPIIMALVTMHFQKKINSEDFFSVYVRAEIIRGIECMTRLYSEVNSPTVFMDFICTNRGEIKFP